MKRARETHKQPSQRQLRVGEAIRHVLADAMTRGVVQDPDLHNVSVTISEVRPSPDLKQATVFCAPLGGADAATVVAVLNRARAVLQSEVGQSLSLKFTPRLTFKADDSFERAAALDRLLQSDQVARDLGPAAAPGTQDNDKS